MNNPEIVIKRAVSELVIKNEQEIEIFVVNEVEKENGPLIKIAVSDKGTPVIFISNPKSVIVEEWQGTRHYKEFMNDLWDKEHKNDPIEE